MTITCLDLVMENLKQVIGCDKRPQFQLLFQELERLRILVTDLEKSRTLEKRIRDVVDETEDIVDLFLTRTSIRNNATMTICRADDSSWSSNVDSVIDEIRSICKEVTGNKMQSWKEVPQHIARTFGNSSSNVVPKEEIIVGLDDDSMVLVERLTGNLKKLDVVSIVGMGGLGKTTLATKVFNYPFVVYHFHVRAWVSVSQEYNKKDVLIALLTSICKLAPEEVKKLKVDKISELFYKSLKGKRYLIVIDDIWSTKAWDDLKMHFPNDNTRSRIMLTTRLSEIAFYAKPTGFAHRLRFLTEKESWELLCKKVFRADHCPENLVKPGMKIAKRCQGLPLALVVIAGLLMKSDKRQDVWEKVAECVISYIAGDPKGYLDTLALSLDHLPRHLRDCFLYVGGFPEDCKIPVRRLIWLWIAEGFIHEDGQKTLEQVAEDYLMDLVDRSLLIVAKRRSNGGVKACRIHDLLRELCQTKASEENFFSKTSIFTSFADKQRHRRLFADSKYLLEIASDHSAPCIRSFLCFNKEWYFSLGAHRCFHPFLLLRVLDLQTIHTPTVPFALELLFHLRHLALWSEVTKLPSAVCNLRNLQTLILKENYSGFMKLPDNMAKMVNLRHLWIEMIISIPETKTLTNPDVFSNLQTISMLRLRGRAESLLKRIPNVKKLGCAVYDNQKDYAFPSFVLLKHLETLKVIQPEVYSLTSNQHISFPSTLKKLTLSGCRFPWTDMSNIQWLPNLEVLKLRNYAFEGPSWDAGEGQFRRLKFLKMQNLDIQQWNACSVNFPCLKRMVLIECYYLNGVPYELGDIPTLEMIEVDKRNHGVVKSVNRIQEEQQAFGNYELKVNVIGFFTSIR